MSAKSHFICLCCSTSGLGNCLGMKGGKRVKAEIGDVVEVEGGGGSKTYGVVVACYPAPLFSTSLPDEYGIAHLIPLVWGVPDGLVSLEAHSDFLSSLPEVLRPVSTLHALTRFHTTIPSPAILSVLSPTCLPPGTFSSPSAHAPAISRALSAPVVIAAMLDTSASCYIPLPLATATELDNRAKFRARSPLRRNSSSSASASTRSPGLSQASFYGASPPRTHGITHRHAGYSPYGVSSANGARARSQPRSYRGAGNSPGHVDASPIRRSSATGGAPISPLFSNDYRRETSSASHHASPGPPVSPADVIGAKRKHKPGGVFGRMGAKRSKPLSRMRMGGKGSGPKGRRGQRMVHAAQSQSQSQSKAKRGRIIKR